MHRLVLTALLLAACTSEDARENTLRAPSSLPGGAGAPASSPGTSTAAETECPASAIWTDCNVVESLERAGLVPRRDPAPVSEPPLTIRGLKFLVGNAELELYLYRDRGERERETRKLDTTRYLGYTEPVSMQQLPTLIQAFNVVAILHSRNDQQRERIGDALTAGPSRGYRAP